MPESLLKDRKPLSGKVALVTGAASGIGRASAIMLADAGASLALVDRDEAGLAEVASEIAASGGTARTHCADLADRDAVSGSFDFAVEALGGVDILINCAGVVGKGDSVLTSEDADWDHVMAINAFAPYQLMKLVGRHLVERGAEGRIVNITSSSAHRARLSQTEYGASKSALMQLTRSVAANLGRNGINVNAIAPGVTRTPLAGRIVSDPEVAEQMTSEGPLANLTGRLSEAEDVANAVLFLCLPASRQITGQTIHLSAGAVV